MIRLIVTGGTIDVDHIAPDNSYCFERSFLHEMLVQARCKATVEVQALFLKDSVIPEHIGNSVAASLWRELQLPNSAQ